MIRRWIVVGLLEESWDKRFCRMGAKGEDCGSVVRGMKLMVVPAGNVRRFAKSKVWQKAEISVAVTASAAAPFRSAWPGCASQVSARIRGC